MTVPREAAREYEKLRREVERHDRLYHVLADPEVSDAGYDRLYARLEALERLHPELRTPDSPTQKVGGSPLEKFEKAEHRVPLLSLEKAYDPAELAEWVAQMERHLGRAPEGPYMAEPKIDGDSLELVYEQGLLVLASTRGDGKVGENVTHAVRTIRSVPLRLEGAPELLEVRGEAFIRTPDFREVNRKELERGEEPFANPRNLASGSIKQLDPSVTASRPLRFAAHGVGVVRGRKFKTHGEVMEGLKSLGLPVVEWERCDSLEAVAAFWRRMAERREALDYEIDGIVVKVDDLALRDELGVRSKSPRWAIAWKFAPREETTEILKVDWQVGRSGRLTPVARLRPVALSGVTVSNATLHNPAQIAKLDLRVGDTVVVTRSGDVIPYVVKAIPGKRPRGAKEIPVPSACPTCGARTERTEADVSCPNRFSCPDQLKGAIDHFCSRAAMGIEGIGPEWIDQFVDRGLVRSVADLYALDKGKLLALERMGEKLAQNMLDAIAASKKTTLPRFVNGLGIRQVGEATAAALADHFGSIGRIRSATLEDLQGVRDVGPKVAEAIREFFDEPRRAKAIEMLLGHGIEFARAEAKSDRLAGEVVVFTGGMEAVTRDEAKALAREHGGKTAETVSKGVTLVVAGPGAGSKLDRARQLGIRILDEGAFLNLVGR